MTNAASPLAGRHRWLTNLSTFAVLAGLFIATAYTWVTIHLPEGTRLVFGVTLVVVIVVFNLTGDTIEQRRLSTLRSLGEGTLPPTTPNLLLAANEVMRMPEVAFWLSLVFLLLGPLVVGFFWSAFSPVPPRVVLQVSFIGLIVAPLTAVLALLVSVPRARQVLRDLVAAGLPVTELYAGIPVAFVLRRRLMVFAGVAVFTPLLLVGDLALSRTRALLDQLVAAPDAAAMQTLADAQRSGGLVPLVGLVVLVVLAVSVSAWLFGSMVGGPLKELAEETERLARGEHGAPRFIAGEHETFAASGAIASMEAQLVALLGRLGHAAGQLSGATGALSGSRSNARVQNLDTASSTTGELARSAREIALNAQRVSELAKETFGAARVGRDGADGFMTAMVQVREGNQAIADSVVRLNKRVQQVGKIIEFINGIADKSDLLALNAELEGNKAGEVGRGFSLVAAEMRRLAESVMQSTREIGGLIDEIRDATNAAVMATEAGVKATDAGGALAQKVGEGLSRIVDYANQSADAMQSISLATSQQQAGTDQLVGAMAEIVKSTEASGSASREMLSAHDQLIFLARDLEQTVASGGSDSGLHKRTTS
ncbi:MAG: methyl-accepting chemotaxis protein [Archangium sp.]|nr:methyl-accepting chemotaxis protein [Archangium sp.]MDP3152701.1 methyl-accepting chemotaxis protein [Archangium sp.]MDP3574837.1 methyl-accepting chemotaxis protein [Archangium sp.]